MTLYANAYSGYQFVNWNQNGTVVSYDNTFTFAMPPGGNVYITASFQEDASDFYINSLTDLIIFSTFINSGTTFEWNGYTVPAGAQGKTFHLNTWIENVGYFEPIGTSSNPFRGTFDGGGNDISGIDLDMSGDNNVGLFGYISSTATIKNLIVINSSITGGNNVGGICGYNAGTILNCQYGGSVGGSQYVGGVYPMFNLS